MIMPGVAGLPNAAVTPVAYHATGVEQPTGAVEKSPFGDLLKNAIAGVDRLQQQAASAVTGMLAGNGEDIHDAMIATQKADMAFELTLAVRNKAVAAYQQVMGMQF
jgi:flagellar hook-basal body complex protein FliE